MFKCFFLGFGKVVMFYFYENEVILVFYKGLSEVVGMGYVVFDYERLVQNGLGKIIEELKIIDKGEIVEK